MPQQTWGRPNLEKMNTKRPDERPNIVGPTNREIRLAEFGEQIKQGRKSQLWPEEPRATVMKRAAEMAKNNAKEYGTPTQRLQREMAVGTKNARDNERFERTLPRKKLEFMQFEQDQAKKAAEDRAAWKQAAKETEDAFGKTALQGSTRYGGTQTTKYPDFGEPPMGVKKAAPNTAPKKAASNTTPKKAAPNGTFKGGTPRSKMSASLKIK